MLAISLKPAAVFNYVLLNTVNSIQAHTRLIDSTCGLKCDPLGVHMFGFMGVLFCVLSSHNWTRNIYAYLCY